eukprot:TRINITY_DN49752_c0_g1_i3.p1 TRINITY_DN49752_c0_g1~~TRINITY_DN49752_c0_g1_i3.p1  ORF type:complete len:310 (-),score=68.31 TRINITY_DN49752_c0_g1_i3:82-1011(-)
MCIRDSNDNYPAGDDKLQAPRRGNGADFNPSAEYRMYHGDRVPGFPQHPHRGFETITATITGLIDHSDSKGNCGRFGHGDLEWMTAGAGIVHGEMFPLINHNAPNPLRFFQIWLNLPARNKMADPAFVMHWAPDIPKVSSDGATVTVFGGLLNDTQACAPPPESWASDPANEVAVWHIALDAGGSFEIPPASDGSISRALYFVEGSRLEIGSKTIDQKAYVTVDAGKACLLRDAGQGSEVLMLQGRPIGEPVAQHGPFVMNTQTEIAQAFKDYQQTQFGGWPWEENAVVFPREKGRFARIDGEEQYPSE